MARRRSRSLDSLLNPVVGLAALAAVGAVATRPAPTGVVVRDVVFTAAFAALVTLAATRAKRWTWLVLAGVAATVCSAVPALPLALVALAVGLMSAFFRRPPRAAGALVAGAALVALLVDTNLETHGLSALVTSLAVVPVLASGYRHARRRERRWTRRLAEVEAGAVLVAGLGGAVAALSARPAVERGVTELEDALQIASSGDSEQAASQLRAAARSFEQANGRLSAPWALPLRAIPAAGQNLGALDALTAAAGQLADSAATAAGQADVEALTFRGGRLDLTAVAEVEAPLGRAAVALEEAASDLPGIDSPWLIGPVDQRLARIADGIAEARPQAELALDAVQVAPELLGGDGLRRYLVLFTTPVEARGRYGFPGNFAELTMDNGRLDMTRFGRISELNAGLSDSAVPRGERTLDGPEGYLARYDRFDPAGTWQNITTSPHLPDIAQVAAQLYVQSGGAPLDGVLFFDPWSLAELLEDTGPVAVEGTAEPVTAENAASFLLRDQYVELPDEPERVDALETLAEVTFERLTDGDLPGPRTLGERFGPLVEAGHLGFVPIDPDEADVARRLGLAGAYQPVEGDVLAVTNTNASGNKIDLFLERSLDYEVRWDPATGAVDATATVNLTNTASATGLPGYLIDNAVGNTSVSGQDLPAGTNRTYLSIYSPWLLEEARVNGQPLAVESQVELGRRVYATFLTLPPGGTATVELDLRGGLERGAPYVLDLDDSHLIEPDRADLRMEVAGEGPLTAAGIELADRRGNASLVLDGDQRVTVRDGVVDESGDTL
ncbi:hypothetical protein BH24ACT3_BH24ACT3_18520 [soil metagenome]